MSLSVCRVWVCGVGVGVWARVRVCACVRLCVCVVCVCVCVCVLVLLFFAGFWVLQSAGSVWAGWPCGICSRAWKGLEAQGRPASPRVWCACDGQGRRKVARDDKGRMVGQRSKKDFSKSWGCPLWPGHKVGHKVTWPFWVPRGQRAVFGSGARVGEWCLYQGGQELHIIVIWETGPGP